MINTISRERLGKTYMAGATDWLSSTEVSSEVQVSLDNRDN